MEEQGKDRVDKFHALMLMARNHAMQKGQRFYVIGMICDNKCCQDFKVGTTDGSPITISDVAIGLSRMVAMTVEQKVHGNHPAEWAPATMPCKTPPPTPTPPPGMGPYFGGAS